jgi:hypothetical protein
MLGTLMARLERLGMLDWKVTAMSLNAANFQRAAHGRRAGRVP